MNKQKFLKNVGTELEISRYPENTIKTYTQCLNKFLIYCNKHPRRISQKDVKRFILEELKECTSKTIRVYMASIKISFSFLGYKDPTKKIRGPRRRTTFPIILSQKEIKRFFEKIKNKRDRLIVGLLYGCGLRVSEVTNLKTFDLDFENRSGYVRNGKGNKDRVLIIPKNLFKELKELVEIQKKNNEEFVFTSYNGKLNTRTIQKMIKFISEKSEIGKKINPHTFRHSFATHLIDNDENLLDVQTLMGHKDIQSTINYIHLSTKRLGKVRSPFDCLEIFI